MLVVMKPDATVSEISGVIKAIESLGLKPHPTRGSDRTIVGVTEAIGSIDLGFLENTDGVEQVLPISKAYKMVSREFKQENTVVKVGGVAAEGVDVGGNNFVVFAGPCAVESYEQVSSTARAVRDAGARVLRGGAFKPRTSPYSFQGMGEEGLELLAEARETTGLSIVTEVPLPAGKDIPILIRPWSLL